MLCLVTVDCTLRESKPLRYAPVRSTADQCLIDAVPLRVVAHGAPSGHRVNLLPGSRTHCCRSYLPRARSSSFASHSLTLFSYQIGPMASRRLGRGMRRKFLRDKYANTVSRLKPNRLPRAVASRTSHSWGTSMRFRSASLTTTSIIHKL